MTFPVNVHFIHRVRRMQKTFTRCHFCSSVTTLSTISVRQVSRHRVMAQSEEEFVWHPFSQITSIQGSCFMRSPLLFCSLLLATILHTHIHIQHNNAVFPTASRAGDIVRETPTQPTTRTLLDAYRMLNIVAATRCVGYI
jgi:hypothetical protein